ncbi:discoidin domain-containing protein [Caloramator australicus]|uniref:F5/8 type C domain-containing protein n=1 Tax=Caloramator australicus RC3 TaxID=857293 RepID=I7K6E9_9CLOT|nr:discoidin domain-containing protein [Caloramator australicus]CCJ33134.1 hypothetical protein CAAU_1050 [Caloramator australicus RC3]
MAKGKVSDASSVQDRNSVYSFDKAFDDNSNTRWSSQYTDNEWIYVDLGSVKNIKRVILNWAEAYGKSYDIQVSNDTTNWTTVYSTNNGDGGIDDISLSTSGRYVRMLGRVRGTSYGYSLYDFEVYDTSPNFTFYNYDKDGKIKDVSINSGGKISYQYDILGRLYNKVISTGSASFTTNYSYEAGAYQNSTTNRLSEIDNNGKKNKLHLRCKWKY